MGFEKGSRNLLISRSSFLIVLTSFLNFFKHL
nr:MAG TPA: hypothetical protein [Caudoviricetes sp.]